MEKNNGVRLLAVVALVVAIAGLSLGFAAFSTTLKIDTVANVTAGANNWNVGFSADGTNIASTSISNDATVDAEDGNSGVLNVTKYTISQKTNATLSTTSNSSVEYNFSVLNKGTLTAYLDSVTFDSPTVTCANAPASSSSLIEGVAGAGTVSTGGNSSTISNADCAKMFKAELLLDGTTYDASTASITPASINANDSISATLVVSYIDDEDANEVAATLDGDIVVTVGSISVVYTSTAPAGSGE